MLLVVLQCGAKYETGVDSVILGFTAAMLQRDWEERVACQDVKERA